MWLLVVRFTCPTNSSVPHYCTVSTFNCLSQFVFKIEHFYFVSVENHIQKYGQEGFFSLNLCETQTLNNYHIQAGANDFQCFLWIFWVCWLSPMWYNVVCSQLMSQFDGYQLQLVYPTVEHRPARTLQQGTSQTFDMFNQSRHFLHTTHKSFFFLHFSCIFTFLEIMKNNMLKMLLFSSIFNIQKFTGFGKFLKKFMLLWQLPQYNLTKLFWMKLKITKRYLSHLLEKSNELFGQPSEWRTLQSQWQENEQPN